MSTQKKDIPATPATKSTQTDHSHDNVLFTRENYKWMIIGVIVMAIGYFLMAGGKSSDPNVFNDAAIYSFRRITLAPILIVAGLVIEIFAIVKRQK